MSCVFQAHRIMIDFFPIPYSFNAMLKPVSLSCGHSGCLVCLWQLTKSTANSKCPMCRREFQASTIAVNREFKIRRLRTTTTEKHATAHDQNHVTVRFSRVVLRLRWVVELFRAVATTEKILLLIFCRLGTSRISSFRKNVFNPPALSEREAKYVSCV